MCGVKCYLTCTAMCSIRKSMRSWSHRHGWMLMYVALLSSLLHLFLFYILVLHLKQKHEDGQRLFHYLQQTSNALAKCTCIILKINEHLWLKIKVCHHDFSVKISEVCRNFWTFRVSNYDCSCTHGYTGFYWNSTVYNFS